jgi:hypothetical protein
MRAIVVNPGLSLIPVFATEKNTRLTEKGIESVQMTFCTIYNGNMLPLATGVAMRVPEDAHLDSMGTRISFGRALKDLQAQGIITNDERKRLIDVLEKVIQEKESPKERMDKLVQQIRQAGLSVRFGTRERW